MRHFFQSVTVFVKNLGSYPAGWVPLVVVCFVASSTQNSREIDLHHNPTSSHLISSRVTIDTVQKRHRDIENKHRIFTDSPDIGPHMLQSTAGANSADNNGMQELSPPPK